MLAFLIITLHSYNYLIPFRYYPTNMDTKNKLTCALFLSMKFILIQAKVIFWLLPSSTLMPCPEQCCPLLIFSQYQPGRLFSDNWNVLLPTRYEFLSIFGYLTVIDLPYQLIPAGYQSSRFFLFWGGSISTWY